MAKMNDGELANYWARKLDPKFPLVVLIRGVIDWMRSDSANQIAALKARVQSEPEKSEERP